MKIISHVKEEKFLLSVSGVEFRQITGIDSYRISEKLDLDLAIIRDTELEISNGFSTASTIKRIVQRESFKDMKNGLLNAVRAIEEAETKFCNINRILEPEKK